MSYVKIYHISAHFLAFFVFSFPYSCVGGVMVMVVVVDSGVQCDKEKFQEAHNQQMERWIDRNNTQIK